MASIADSSIKIGVDVDEKSFESQINNLSNVGNRAFKALGVGIAAFSASFVTASAGALSLASDLQEVQNVVDVTFGDNAEKINEFAKSASEAFGLGETQAKKYTSTLGAMVKSMGLSEEQTYAMSTSLAGLTGDMASFYNLDHEIAFEKIRSGISGETEPLKQLGINMSVAALEAYAMSQGVTKAFKDMSESEKTLLRYNFLLQATTDAQGDYKRTLDGYANQLRSADIDVKNLGTTFGNYLLPIATRSLGSIRTALQEFNTQLQTPEMEQAITKIGDAFSRLFTGTISAITTSIPSFLEAVASSFSFLAENIDMIGLAVSALTGAFLAMKGAAIVSGLITAYTALGGVIGIATKAQLLFNLAMKANPIGFVISVVGALIGALTYLYNTNDKVRIGMQIAWNFIKYAIYRSIQDILNSFQRFVDMYNFAADVIGAEPIVIDTRLDALDETIENIHTLKDEWNSLGDVASKSKEEVAKLNETIEDNPTKDSTVAELSKDLGDANREIVNLRNLLNTPTETPQGGTGGGSGESATGGSQPTGIIPVSEIKAPVKPVMVQEGTQELLQESNDLGNKAGEKVTTGINRGVESVSGILSRTFSDTFRSILDGEKSLSESFKDMGKNLLTSLADSMLNTAMSAITPTLNSAFGSIINTAMGIFGIASPSKVFKDVGYWNMKGLAVGIDDNTGVVTTPLQGLSDELQRSFTLPSLNLSQYQGMFPTGNLSTAQIATAKDGNNFVMQPNIIINNSTGEKASANTSYDNQGNFNTEVFVGNAVSSQMSKPSSNVSKSMKGYGIKQQVVKR